MSNSNCPYCETEYEYTGDGLDDGETEEVQCGKCDKFFLLRACISVDYDAEQADCLNGSPHPMKDSMRYPRVIHGKCQQRCEDCEMTQDRPATQEEIDKHGDFPKIEPKDQWGKKHQIVRVPDTEGLVSCTVCHGAEGSLTRTDCPGRHKLSSFDENRVMAGWDFKDGRWVAPAVCGKCGGSKEIPAQYSQSTGKTSWPCPCCT